jgi:hypothetical protein
MLPVHETEVIPVKRLRRVGLRSGNKKSLERNEANCPLAQLKKRSFTQPIISSWFW